MRFHVCLACFLFFAGALFAQSDRGVITGAVLDQAGAVVPSANVVARNTETGAQYQTQTTATGNYTLSQLPAGSYDLSVEAAGFNKFVQQGIRVFVARTERVDVTLRVGGTTESITVSADASLLKTENAEQSTTIGVEKLDELPLNFGANGNNASANIRNPYTFVTLVPTGTISSYSTIRLNGAPINTFQVRVEGQQANNNRLMIRQDQLQPSVEALEEVSVQASNFSAEYGQVAGGMFNLTAKSGTNQFHGSLFEYFVNEDLGAGIPFTNSGHGHLLRPPNRRNDFGGSFGGPVWIPKLYDGHNRTFFFFAIEEFYQRQVTAGVRQTVPTLAMRTGDFSGALTGKVLGTDPAGRQILENEIYDPTSDHTVNGQIVRDPFPNNTIPMSRFDPVALKIQSLIPAPVRSGTLNNWDQSYAQVTTERIPSIKIDQFFPNQGKLSFFYSRYVGPHYNGSDGLPVPITMVRLINTLSYTIRLNYDQPVTPTFLVHAGVGFVRHPNPDYSIPEVLNYDPIAGLGLKGALFGKGFPGISSLSSPTGGGMGLNMGANGAPIWLNKPTAVLSASLVRSNHTYKAGGEWRIDALTQKNFTGEFGQYTFNLAQTSLPYTQGQSISGGNVGLPYASFLMGLVNTASISNPVDPQTRKPSWSLFAQDNWKITRKLTLDYGLRWDYQGYGDEIHHRVSEFSPITPNPVAGGLPGATIYEGNGPGTCNCTFTKPYPYAIGPRIGVAYQFLPKTVLRAGWGITYAETNQGQSSALSTLGAGGWNTLSFSSPTYGAPALILSNGLNYSLADLYNVTYNPGIRPSPGQINSPPNLIDRNAGRPARLSQWNISLQREITKDLVLEAAYVGNRGVWFESDAMINLNANTPERLAAFGLDIKNSADQKLLTSPLNSPQVQALGFKAPYPGFPVTATLAQALRPYPQFGNITVQGAPLGNTWYDSLQVKLTKRVSHGLDFLGTFVWQKETDTTEGYVNNVFNRSLQKTLSSLSQPLALVIAFSYQTPGWGSKRWMRTALGGWTFTGILKYASGLPIPVPIAQNNLNALLFNAVSPTNVTDGLPVSAHTAATYANRVPGQPLFLKDLNCHCIDPNKDLVLNPAAWSQPPAGQFGSSNPFYGDYRYARTPNEQVGLGRTFSIRERVRFQIRAEFFNVFNRTYLNPPTSTNALQTATYNAQGLLTGGFGYINPGSVLNPPRNGQLVARIQF